MSSKQLVVSVVVECRGNSPNKQQKFKAILCSAMETQSRTELAGRHCEVAVFVWLLPGSPSVLCHVGCK